MPNFSGCCESDEYLCQICGRPKCSNCYPPVWVEGRGNACPDCQQKCLVICKDDEGTYRIATRQLMTVAVAENYLKGIAVERDPLIIHPNVDWDLRQ